MKTQNHKYLSLFFILTILLFGMKGKLTFAQTLEDIDEAIVDLKNDIQAKQGKIDNFENKIDAFRRRIETERTEALTLKQQIQVLNTQIQKTETAISLKQTQIEQAQQKIALAIKEIDTLNLKISHLQNNIGELLYNLYIADQTTPLETVIVNESLSDFFNTVNNLESISASLKEKITEIKNDRAEAEEKKITMEEAKTVLLGLKEGLGNEKQKITDQKTVKNILLDETRKNEALYQELLKQARAEQAAIDAEIRRLEKELRTKLLQKAEKEKSLEAFKGEPFIWPVPKNIITARFRDPDYPFRHVFEHPAIDVRAKHGTPVKAAASGYVGKVQRDPNCTGRYAYVMIIHADDLSTVYGHLSRIDLEEEQFIAQGEQIGLSGATPRTCGAGRLTTGPHMHFEVRKNGIPQNPKNYLP